MPLIKEVNRAGLIDVLDSEAGATVLSGLLVGQIPSGPRSEEMVLVWPELPTNDFQVPPLIIVRPEGRQDLLAWTATYAKSFRPFTAYCRVLEVGRDRIGPSGISLDLSKMVEVFVGAILAEAAGYVDSADKLKQLSIIACENTYSYLAARSALLQFVDSGSSELFHEWLQLRKLTRQTSLKTPGEEVSFVWRILGASRRSSGIHLEAREQVILQAFNELIEKGDVQESTWSTLTAQLPHVKPIRRDILGSREAAVDVFERLFSAGSSARQLDDPRTGFVCGYLASQIGRGAFDYLSLVDHLVPALPSARLWYGVCCGTKKKSELLDFASGLGRRLARDLQRPDGILSRPTCDLAAAELKMFMQHEGRKLDFRSRSAGFLEVEVAPCVNVTLRVHDRTEQPRQNEIWESSPRNKSDKFELELLADEFATEISRLSDLRNSFIRRLGLEDSRSPKPKGVAKKPGKR